MYFNRSLFSNYRLELCLYIVFISVYENALTYVTNDGKCVVNKSIEGAMNGNM